MYRSGSVGMSRGMIDRLIFAFVLSCAIAGPAARAQDAPTSAAPASAPAAQAEIYAVEIVARYPHDPDAYTQGLLWHDGHLFESTGRVTKSQIRKIDLPTGKVLARNWYPAGMFGEGMTIWGDELVSLTWRDGTIFRWKLADLSYAGRHREYPFEGWGLTTLGNDLVASDGSSTLRFLDPQTYEVRRAVTVTLGGRPVPRINELEAIDGLIWANQWYSEAIIGIDPHTGEVTRIADLGPMVREVAMRNPDAVLNGIAHDPQTGRWFATGKLWPTLFEFRLVPATETDEPAG